MYKLCQTPRTIQRSQHISSCLLSMMTHTHFNDITISALCKEAGVPRKSFYRYFDTKEDVFHLLLDTLMTECIRLCEMDAHKAVEVTIERLTVCFRFWSEQKAVFDAAGKSGMMPHILTRMLQYYELVISPEQNSIPASDEQIRTIFAMTGMFSMILQWYESGFARSPEEMALLTFDILKKPLLPS